MCLKRFGDILYIDHVIWADNKKVNATKYLVTFCNKSEKNHFPNWTQCCFPMLKFEKNTAVRHLMHPKDISLIINIINLKLEKKCHVFFN